MAPQAVAASCTGNTAMLRKTKLCKFFEEGECTRGDACSFAHSTHNLQSRPDLHKTQYCLAFQRNSYCQNGANCKFAHGDSDLKATAKLGNALPKPIGLQGRPGYVASFVAPVAVPVPDMVATSTSKPTIQAPTSRTSAWPSQSMSLITRDEKWTCPVTEDDPDTPSTTFASPWESETNHACDFAFTMSIVKWNRQVSEASSNSSSIGHWRGQIKDRAFEIKHDESHMPRIEFHTSNSVNRDPVQEARSPETGVALITALQRTKLCSFYQHGFCKTGLSCKFAHELGELRSRPNLFRTGLCMAFSRGHCKRGKSCKFAHGPGQLQGNSVQNFDKRNESQLSQFDTAEQGETDKKPMQMEIVPTLLGPSTDIGSVLGVQVTVKNTFINVNVCKLDGRRRSVSCER